MRSLLARPDLIDAAVLYAPVHSQAYDNFYRWRADDMSEEELQSWNERLGDLTMRESFAPFSPATYVDQIAIPIQIYHGTNDESVPYDRSLQTIDYFEQA